MIILLILAMVILRIFYSLAEIYYERDWPRRTWKGLLLSIALLLFGASAFGQAVRIDIPVLTSGPNVAVGGQALPQALWLTNPTIQICAHPATLNSCSYVTTYTDITATVPCPGTQQITQLPSPSTCSSLAGTLGNIGFWYAGGTVDYIVTSPYGTFGPYTVTGVNGAGGFVSLTQTLPQTMLGPLFSPQLNGIWSCTPATTIAACIALLPGTGGTIQLQTGTYSSGLVTCMAIPNVTIIGAGTPEFNSGNTALVGGTIIQGTVPICANNLSISNLGIDVGSAFIGGGTAVDGLDMIGAGSPNPADPILVGAYINNVVILGPGATVPVHAFLVEHYSNVDITNSEARNAQHCLALKSSFANVTGFKFSGCSVDGLTLKSDAYTSLTQIALTNINGHQLSTPSDTNGIQIVASGTTGTTSGVTISNVVEDGTVNGITLTNSSTVGAGALSNITLNNFNVTLRPTGASPPTCGLTSGTATIANLTVNGFLCDNESSQAAAPFAFDLSLTASTLNNLNFINGGFASDIEGIVTINGISESGPATAQATIIDQVSSATVLQIYGWSSNRGNYAFSTTVGATAYIAPPPSIISWTGGTTVAAAGPLTAGSIATSTSTTTLNTSFTNTTGASVLQNISTGSPFNYVQTVSSVACWEMGQPAGNTFFEVADCTSGGTPKIFKLAQGAPDSSLAVDVSGNTTINSGAQVVLRCATAGALPTGALTINAASCGTTTDTGLRLK